MWFFVFGWAFFWCYSCTVACVPSPRFKPRSKAREGERRALNVEIRFFLFEQLLLLPGTGIIYGIVTISIHTKLRGFAQSADWHDIKMISCRTFEAHPLRLFFLRMCCLQETGSPPVCSFPSPFKLVKAQIGMVEKCGMPPISISHSEEAAAG